MEWGQEPKAPAKWLGKVFQTASSKFASSNPEQYLEELKRLLGKSIVKTGPDSPRTSAAALQLANAFCDLGRFDDELPLRRKHFAACQRHLGPDDLRTVASEMRLARCLVQLKKVEEADPLIRHAVAVQTSELGRDDPHTVLAVSLGAIVARQLGRFEEAKELHLRLLQWVEVYESTESVSLATLLMVIGKLMTEWHEFDEASEFYVRALEIRREFLGPDDVETLQAQLFLALTSHQRGRSELAVGLSRL